MAGKLSVYATVTRYPGEFADVTAADHDEAVRLAEAIYRWACTVVFQRGEHG